jgi:hypothetical protein
MEHSQEYFYTSKDQKVMPPWALDIVKPDQKELTLATANDILQNHHQYYQGPMTCWKIDVNINTDQ